MAAKLLSPSGRSGVIILNANAGFIGSCEAVDGFPSFIWKFGK